MGKEATYLRRKQPNHTCNIDTLLGGIFKTQICLGIKVIGLFVIMKRMSMASSITNDINSKDYLVGLVFIHVTLSKSVNC